MRPRPTKDTAFTLIELLVVIAIIAILMGLLFPAANTVMDAAKKAIAKNDVTQIANAITAYQTEYGSFPTNTTLDGASGTAISGDFLGALMGTNTRGITFIEVQTWKKGKGGMDSNGAYMDPWSNPYKYVVTYGNAITNNGTTIRKSVAVFNFPSGSDAANSNRHTVRSWE